MDLTVYLYRVRTTRPQVSTRWFPAFDYVADANEVIEEKVDVVSAERERLAAEFDDWRDDDRLQPAFVAKWIRDA